MVGTVRNKEQLSYNLSHKCYYVPGRFISKELLPIRYIALLEQDEEDIPCIQRFGRIQTTEILPRGIIPVTMRSGSDPKEPYYYFTVEEWINLPRKITIQDTARGKPLFTNRFLLEHCRRSYELFVIDSQKDYALLEAICQVLDSSPEEHPVCSVGKERRLILNQGVLSMTNRRGQLLGKIPVRQYTENPRKAFLYFKKL